MKKLSILFLITLLFVGCSRKMEDKLNPVAQNYVKIILSIGNYDSDYVDAYYGPKELRDSISKSNITLAEISKQIDSNLDSLESIGKEKLSNENMSRLTFLYKQLLAAKTHVAYLQGIKLPFALEAKNLYDIDIKPSAYDAANLKAEIEKLLPGTGNISERYNQFKNQFIIPKEKLDTVFKAAIAETRKRTLEHIKLNPDEKFQLEYVTDKPWAGYNWYKGNSFSVIQINTSLPIYIDRVIDIAAHEGYPGHHVYNSLLEQNLAKGRGWVEFTVYPLFSPQSLIAEGSANYGIEVVFTKDEKMKFEKSVILPLAGLDTTDLYKYYTLMSLFGQLDHLANNYAADYLDGKISKDETVKLYCDNILMTKEKAEQRIKFLDKYRSYIINYSLGFDLVKSFIEKSGGSDANPQKRWEVFQGLLSNPVTPSSLEITK